MSGARMQQLPTISVITPSLNHAVYLERTIRSVLGQEYPHLDYIVIDGGSTDGTLDILRQYEDRLRWVSGPDSGQSDAINKGLRMANGEILAYLNSDDTYADNALMTVGRRFAAEPTALWITGRCRIIDEHDREIRGPITMYKNWLLDHYSYRKLLITNFISQPATFLRKKLVDELGFFDCNESLVMDYEYWLRVARHDPPVILHEHLANFRIHAASKTTGERGRTIRDELRVGRMYSRSPLLNMVHYLHAGIMRFTYAFIDLFPHDRGRNNGE